MIARDTHLAGARSLRGTVARLALFAVVLTSASEALAGGGGGGAHTAGEPHFNWKELGWHAGNLLVFLAGLVILLRKPLAQFLGARRAAIAEGLEEAARLRSEAAAKLQDLEARMSNLTAEREHILSTFREEGERERQRLVEAARAAGEAIRRDASLTLEQDSRGMRRIVRDRAVEASLALAEQLVQAELDGADRLRLADEYIDKLPAAVAQSTVGGR